MPHLFCSLLQQLGFIPGTNAQHYHSSSYLCSESWDSKGQKLPVMSCVCARVRTDGHVAQPLAGPAASQGTNLIAENMAKGGKENWLIPPALCNQLLCYFCSVKTGTWEDSVSKCCASFRLRAKMGTMSPWAEKQHAGLAQFSILSTACKLFLSRSCPYSIPKLELNSAWRNRIKELLFACKQLLLSLIEFKYYLKGGVSPKSKKLMYFILPTVMKTVFFRKPLCQF